MNKKNQISDTARKLFNKYGTNNINTNNIAKECGISPGNLYYHYRNKEEIIRKLFSEIIIFMDKTWGGEINNILIFFTEMLEKLIKLHEKYTFFYREMFSLFSKDKELEKSYKELLKKRKIEIMISLKEAIKKGLFKELSKEELDNYIELVWLNTDFYILMCELNEATSYENKVKKFKRNMYNITYVYLTEKGKMILEELLF